MERFDLTTSAPASLKKKLNSDLMAALRCTLGNNSGVHLRWRWLTGDPATCCLHFRPRFDREADEEFLAYLSM
jgi:hypothetical protein